MFETKGVGRKLYFAQIGLYLLDIRLPWIANWCSRTHQSRQSRSQIHTFESPTHKVPFIYSIRYHWYLIMFKRLFGQILLHLGDLEDEFRLFHLRDDIAMFIITAVCMLLANVIMLRVDFILYQTSMDLFYLMIPFRSFSSFHGCFSMWFISPFSALRGQQITWRPPSIYYSSLGYTCSPHCN